MSNLYATVTDVESGFRKLDGDESDVCEALIKEAGVIIDSYGCKASEEKKKVVVCRMVRRAIGMGSDIQVPLGTNQGTISALGYSQTWTLSGGSTGELYLNRIEKKLLGVGANIGVYNPLLVNQENKT